VAKSWNEAVAAIRGDNDALVMHLFFNSRHTMRSAYSGIVFGLGGSFLGCGTIAAMFPLYNVVSAGLSSALGIILCPVATIGFSCSLTTLVMPQIFRNVGRLRHTTQILEQSLAARFSSVELDRFRDIRYSRENGSVDALREIAEHFDELGRRADARFIRALPNFKVPVDWHVSGNPALKRLEETCVICLEPMNQRMPFDRFGRTGCGHEFHSQCVYKWMQQNPTCPVCRTRLSTLGDYD
jgi:hypothetical protein